MRGNNQRFFRSDNKNQKRRQGRRRRACAVTISNSSEATTRISSDNKKEGGGPARPLSAGCGSSGRGSRRARLGPAPRAPTEKTHLIWFGLVSAAVFSTKRTLMEGRSLFDPSFSPHAPATGRLQRRQQKAPLVLRFGSSGWGGFEAGRVGEA